MKPYNVEIFDREMKYVCNTVCDEVKYKSDYLDPERWTLDLNGITPPEVNYFIHVQRDSEDYIGIIQKYVEKNDGTISVTVSEFPSFFDVNLIVPVDDMKNYSLEQYISKWITDLFISGDTSMKLPLVVEIDTTTEDWVLEYELKNEPQEDEPAPPVLVAEMNLFDDIILPAFLQYQIRLDYSINLKTKQIVINIGKNTLPSFVIESELPNILNKEITIKKSSKTINKVIVYDTEDYNHFITYYLHTDDSYDTEDRDRIQPVFYEIQEASKEVEEQEGVEVVIKTFEESALEKAESSFKKNKYTNLIELEMFIDDDLINPTQLKIGQVVSVISEGMIYESILTGVQLNNKIKLIFGTIRLELTKILKGRA